MYEGHDHQDRVTQAYRGQGVDQETAALTRNRIHWITDQVPSGVTADVGCSQGIVSFLLAERGDEAVGFDVSKAALEFAEAERASRPADQRSRVSFAFGDAVAVPAEDASFDSAVVGEVLEHVDDPIAVARELFRILKPGGTVVVTVPFGVMPHEDHHRVFYLETIERLLGPLFETKWLGLLEKHVGFVGTRREIGGEPVLYFPPQEAAFRRWEEQYWEQIESLRSRTTAANDKYRASTTQLGELKSSLAARTAAVDAATSKAASLELERSALSERVATAEARVGEYRDELEGVRAELDSQSQRNAELVSRVSELNTKLGGALARAEKAAGAISDAKADAKRIRERLDRSNSRLAAIEGSKAWRTIVRYRRFRELLPGRARSRARERVSRVASKKATVATPKSPSVAVKRGLEGSQSFAPLATTDAGTGGGSEQSVQLRRLFERWLVSARSAAGTDVVFMFSGTTFVQQKRGNRPIRLTNIFLREKCPVFFNYYRWRGDEPFPDHPDPLLYQSPIDITPGLLDELLYADFGGKRKILFASFPHELMVRNIAKAQQAGWSVIYDVRDDWEAFSEVGAAKWYDKDFERYVAKQADLVSAVSWPLAQKIALLSSRNDVVVSANALDDEFPTRDDEREATLHPVVGYFGHLTAQWFDWDLVIEAAKRNPEWTFELAGHQAPDLVLPANIKLLGLLSHAEIASVSGRWSMAIIPFKGGVLTEAVDPIKVYEYLHLGLPVLATYFPQMVSYPGVWISDTQEAFLQLLPVVASKEIDTAEVNEWLGRNRWQDRVSDYRAMVEAARAETPGLGRLLRR